MFAFAQAADLNLANPDDGTVGLMILVGVLVASTIASVIPAGLAFLRGHRSAWAILIVCVFFGWTCVGWGIALMWAMGDTGRGRR